jgi:hypothetical protein
MQDLVPWSLIYASQNDQHVLQMEKKNIELALEKNRIYKLAIFVVHELLGSSTSNFNDSCDNKWLAFESILDVITDADIDTALFTELDIIDNAYGFFCQHTHDEMNNRANICKQLLAASHV